MKNLKERLMPLYIYIKTFIKWAILATFTGVIGGGIGTMFYKGIEYATEFRMANPILIAFLPLSGLMIVFMYRITKMNHHTGTNNIIQSIRTREEVPLVLTPLIFVSTIITHLFGGSAGREGAALQLGGGIGAQLGHVLRLDEKDMHIIILCGMSSVFTALFGTPLTATIFSLEVVSVGIFYYSAFVPCIISSLLAFKVAAFFGAVPERYILAAIPELDFLPVAKVAVLAFLCAGVSILFCLALRKTTVLLKRLFSNEYIRIFCVGLFLVVLTFVLRTTDYNGTGVHVIARALTMGEARSYDFLLKIVFTALTICAGFRGGEIVPTFFIGATFGCFAGHLFGLPPTFAAAIGLIATFCGVVNCPIASMLLSIELFDIHANAVVFFGLAVAISYMFSGYYGLYGSQKIMYSKLKAEFINIHAK